LEAAVLLAMHFIHGYAKEGAGKVIKEHGRNSHILLYIRDAFGNLGCVSVALLLPRVIWRPDFKVRFMNETIVRIVRIGGLFCEFDSRTTGRPHEIVVHIRVHSRRYRYLLRSGTVRCRIGSKVDCLSF